MSLREVVRGIPCRAGAVRVESAFDAIARGCAVAAPACFSFAAVLGYDPALPVLTLVGA